jgi:hypothetical protein
MAAVDPIFADATVKMTTENHSNVTLAVSERRWYPNIFGGED